MLPTSFSRSNILCSCKECTTFLRPYPTLPHPTPIRLSPGDPLSYTPSLTPKRTPFSTSQLTPTAPTSTPLSNPQTKPRSLTTFTPPPDNTLARVYHLSLTLFTRLSSPISPPLTSAKTPGLASCLKQGCVSKLVPVFGRSLCNVCEADLKDVVTALLHQSESSSKSASLGEETGDAEIKAMGPSRVDSVVDSVVDQIASDQIASKDDEELESSIDIKELARAEESPLFGTPSTKFEPYKPSIAIQKPAQDEHSTILATNPIQSAIPSDAIDESASASSKNLTIGPTIPGEEALSPNTKYAMDFPPLPTKTISCAIFKSTAGEKRGWASRAKILLAS